jgi:glutamate racemase
MKIGAFDSGLGGLIVLRAMAKAMPEYDFAYLGDVARVPYGPQSRGIVYGYTESCMDFMMRELDCALVIIACNTATFAALRDLQTEWLPRNFPDRKILGVVIPTVEEIAARGLTRVGLIATAGTVGSQIYDIEARKISPDIRIVSHAAPLLVPLIENDGDECAPMVVEKYLRHFSGTGIQSLILGCTHYPYYKNLIRECAADILGAGTGIISQDEIIPESLAKYLARHSEIGSKLTRNHSVSLMATDLNPGYLSVAEKLFRDGVTIKKIDI